MFMFDNYRPTQGRIQDFLFKGGGGVSIDLIQVIVCIARHRPILGLGDHILLLDILELLYICSLLSWT